MKKVTVNHNQKVWQNLEAISTCSVEGEKKEKESNTEQAVILLLLVAKSRTTNLRRECQTTDRRERVPREMGLHHLC